MNHSALLGRITEVPELKQTTSGVNFVKFTLAVRRTRDVADFIDCVAWEETANRVLNLKKGELIAVEGELQTYNYELQDGTRRKSYEVCVRRIYYTGSKTAAERENEQSEEV
jgi:single-strand DNA-binding protein